MNRKENKPIGCEKMDRKGAVADFLQRCIEYTDASIERKKARGDHDEIDAWQSYREFTEHALMEINTGKLDPWFESEENENLSNPKRIEVEGLPHKERATWFSGILSPRPLVLASTKNSDGVGNLAPLTSVMAVSTSPPLLIASLSRNREGIYRNTYYNLKDTKKAILHMMPSTLESVNWVDDAASPIPSNESEWDLTGLTKSTHDPMLIEQAIAGLEVEFVEEMSLPDAVAKLVVMRVTHIWTQLEKPPLSGLDVLCQHGIDRLTPTPENWSKTVYKHYG